MSPPSVNPSQTNFMLPARATGAFVPALFWATAMLGVLTWWLYARDLALGMPIVAGTGILTVVSLLLLLKCLLQHYQAHGDVDAIERADAANKPLLGLVFLV